MSTTVAVVAVAVVVGRVMNRGRDENGASLQSAGKNARRLHLIHPYKMGSIAFKKLHCENI
jgi:hypothetical protein